jgi:hypothetical protein
MKLEVAKYRSRAGWLPYVEIAVGCYFLAMVAYAIETYNFFAVPFLTISSQAIGGQGSRASGQDWQGRLRWRRQRKLELGRSAAGA